MKFQQGFSSLLRRIFLLMGMCTLVALFAPQVPSAFAESPSFIRIIHASPDIGTVDVFVDGNKILSSFQFATVTGYVTLPAGTHMVQIALIGKGVNASVITQSMSVSAGVPYTVAALGLKSTGFSLQVFTDNNFISSKWAKLRVYHLSPGTGTVNVLDSGKNTSVVQGLGYEQASNYVNLPAGSYTFNVEPTSANTTLPVTANLTPWTVTSIFAVGVVNVQNSEPKIQIVSSQAPGTPGLPGTGSDPRPLSHAASAQSAQSWSPNPWLVALLGSIIIAAMASYRLGTSRPRKQRNRA